MAEEAQGGSGNVAQAAAGAVTPDALTADLLARHSAGESLSPKEYGKLGAWSAKVKAIFQGKGSGNSAGAGPAQPGGATGNAARVGALPPGEAPGDGLPPVPPDPRVVQRTTECLIKAVDGIARRKISSEARKAGADEATARRFDNAAGVPVAAKDMMVETSPEVVAAMGLDPQSYPICTFIGGLGLWATNLWLCVDELRAMRSHTPKPESKPAPVTPTAPGPASFVGPSLPAPARPHGAPPDVTCKK